MGEFNPLPLYRLIKWIGDYKMGYIIKFKAIGYPHSEYFTGERYIFQGETYATLGTWDNAKTYKSRKIAERSARSLNENCVQYGIFDVIPLSER